MSPAGEVVSARRAKVPATGKRQLMPEEHNSHRHLPLLAVVAFLALVAVRWLGSG